MIDAREVAKRLKLSAPDEEEVRRLGAEISAAVNRPEYDGRPFNIQIPVGTGEEQHARTYRIACALQRRFQTSGWASQLETTQNAFGQPEVHSLWFAIDPASMREEARPVARAKFSLRDLYDELSQVYGTDGAPVLAREPVLSVLLGTYDRFSLLREAVASIRSSVGGLTYEVVVVDGGSSDGSRAWLAAQPDVLLVGDRHLRGAVVAFNQAFSMCRGEFVANANDDIRYDGLALSEGVRYLREHPEVGQVAFGLQGEGEGACVNEVHPGRPYANHGVVRRSLADKVARIQGGFWNPLYATYAADCEFSAWCHRLSKVVALPHLRVLDARPDDGLRKRNRTRFGADTKRMYSRWPAASFRPDGPEPRVTEAELARYREVRSGARVAAAPVAEGDALVSFAEMVGFPEAQEERRLRKVAPLLRALDPVDGQFPKRADKLGEERVLHLHINGRDAVDQQEGLVRALREFGAYKMFRWTDFEHGERQREIVAAAERFRPTLVFAQLQSPGAVDVETVRRLREVAPGVVIATWNGDVAAENSPFAVDNQVMLNRSVDLALHSSMTHVLAMRAAGIHCAGFLGIGYDEDQYCSFNKDDGSMRPRPGAPRPGDVTYDVAFLGSRYGNGDAFSSTYKWKNGAPAHDAALRDEVVEKMRAAFGERFGLFGSGWGEAAQVVPVTRSHEVYWRSKIGVSISLDNCLVNYTSDRLFRILACGSLLLVKRFPGISTLGLQHGVNCLMFDTAEEAVALAKKALEDEDWLRLALEAGANLVSINHTWRVRCLEMQKYIEVVRICK